MTTTNEIKIGKRRIIEFFIYPLIKECHTTTDISDAVCEEIAHEFCEIVGKINNLEFDRPQKCPNEKFCSYKNICKMNVI